MSTVIFSIFRKYQTCRIPQKPPESSPMTLLFTSKKVSRFLKWLEEKIYTSELDLPHDVKWDLYGVKICIAVTEKGNLYLSLN